MKRILYMRMMERGLKMNDFMLLGKKIRQLRQDKGMTQKEFAHFVGALPLHYPLMKTEQRALLLLWLRISPKVAAFP